MDNFVHDELHVTLPQTRDLERVGYLVDFTPPFVPGHWDDHRISMSWSTRALPCHYCKAQSGKPCVGMSEMTGEMKMHHRQRALCVPEVMAHYTAVLSTLPMSQVIASVLEVLAL